MFGVSMGVVENPTEKVKQTPNYMPLIALNNDGLKEMYEFVGLAYQHFYYIPRVGYEHINSLSENIAILSGPWCNFDLISRSIYIQLSPDSPRSYGLLPNYKQVAALNNFYPTPEDKSIWQIFAGPQRFETTNQHILTEGEWKALWPNDIAEVALQETDNVLNQANVTLEKAVMVKYLFPKSGFGHIRQKMASTRSHGDGVKEVYSPPHIKILLPDQILEGLCAAGAEKLDIDLGLEPMKSRLKHELSMIAEKGFADYFLIVSDLVNYAKEIMLVGPSRGSSAGSLVCYLTGITEIDPLKFNLLFERFIDINRDDLPDIDIDFPDQDRYKVIDYLMEKYGKANVARIGTIAKMMPKSAIGEFAKAMDIPAWETQTLKDAIIERSGGDARAAQCIEDTFLTEVGKEFLAKYPEMILTTKIEGHARHTSTHAAGVIVCADPISKYAGMDLRENVAMLDKETAENDAGLLKIDILGLRTLTILGEICDQINKPYSWLYSISLDDTETFELLDSMKLSGIFQFEGYSLQSLARQMGIQTFNDIVAITALARPGPLHSGGASLFANRRTGHEPIEYLHNHPKIIEITKETYGVIVYQEQVMRIVREIGHLSWKDTSMIRKTMSKTMGDEYFNQFWVKFLEGCKAENINSKDARSIWENVMTFGSWGFNLSHAVSYGLISYLTAYLKIHYPLEFTVATLNNPGTGDNGENNCIKLLREFVTMGYYYQPIDEHQSTDKWEVRSNGKGITGPLTNVKGIGKKICADILEKRKAGMELTQRHIKLLTNGEVKFQQLWPTEDRYGGYYTNPKAFNIINHEVIHIEDIQEIGHYVFIGRLIDRNLRDLNETASVIKRGGKIIQGRTLFLNMTVEDDTGSIICTISRFKFEKFGRDIAEKGKIREDYYLIMGSIKDNWRKISITNIRKLN